MIMHPQLSRELKAKIKIVLRIIIPLALMGLMLTLGLAAEVGGFAGVFPARRPDFLSTPPTKVQASTSWLYLTTQNC